MCANSVGRSLGCKGHWRWTLFCKTNHGQENLPGHASMPHLCPPLVPSLPRPPQPATSVSPTEETAPTVVAAASPISTPSPEATAPSPGLSPPAPESEKPPGSCGQPLGRGGGVGTGGFSVFHL